VRRKVSRREGNKEFEDRKKEQVSGCVKLTRRLVSGNRS
jgi:hypothetical protein